MCVVLNSYITKIIKLLTLLTFHTKNSWLSRLLLVLSFSDSLFVLILTRSCLLLTYYYIVFQCSFLFIKVSFLTFSWSTYSWQPLVYVNIFFLSFTHSSFSNVHTYPDTIFVFNFYSHYSVLIIGSSSCNNSWIPSSSSSVKTFLINNIYSKWVPLKGHEMSSDLSHTRGCAKGT